MRTNVPAPVLRAWRAGLLVPFLASQLPPLLRVVGIFVAQGLYWPSSGTICEVLARRILGADGEDYRADYVHAPFPEN